MTIKFMGHLKQAGVETMKMERKFKVEVSATRVLEITVGGETGIEVLNGESIEDAVEIAARDNLFFTQDPSAVHDIEGWDINIDSIIESSSAP